MYIVILRRLRYAVRRKHPEKVRTSSWFLPHYNPPAHPVGFRQAFLSKEQCDKQELPHYSSDLGPADFYFLLRLNSIEATDNIGRKN
jgi:hypothetical protein